MVFRCGEQIRADLYMAKLFDRKVLVEKIRESMIKAEEGMLENG